MAQFKTARMSDLTPVADVDDHAQAFEDSVVYAFGLPTGSDLTGKIFPSVDLDGNITDIIRSAASPLPGSNTGPGWRSRDTTTGDEFLIMCNNGYLVVYENTGTQSSPVWTERNKMDLSDGKWDIGALTGAFTGCMVNDIFNESTDFRSGDFIQWSAEVFDDTSYWSSANRTRITIPATGRYRMHWSLFIGSIGTDVYTNCSIYSGIRKNGSSWVYDANKGSGTKDSISTSSPGVGVTGHWAGSFTSGDYYELYAYTQGTGDYDGNIHSGHFMIERIN